MTGVFALIKIVVSGADSFQAFLAKLSPAIEKSADETCGLITEMAAARSRDIVPVRTGRLQRSIQVWNPAPMMYQVGSVLNYAPFVEYGTRFMRAQPYLRPAAEEASLQIAQTMKDKLLEALYGW